jgi:hypothetical protein
MAFSGAGILQGWVELKSNWLSHANGIFDIKIIIIPLIYSTTHSLMGF